MKFKEILAEAEVEKQYLTFKISDSAWYGGHTQYLLDDMKLSYAMQEDMSYSWKSAMKLSAREITILKKEITSQLPYDMKKKSYKFDTRKY